MNQPLRESPGDRDFLDGLGGLEKLRYRDIDDVTDADVNVYGVLARKA